MQDNYDIIVAGGGHGGIEAANAAAVMGLRTALLTIRIDTIGQMSCNPAIGGLAKGQIVREIDALGGLMGLLIDQAGIQFRMLNRRKGPAVWAPRAQADRDMYARIAQETLAKIENLTIIEDTVSDIDTTDGQITGIKCESGRELGCKAAILTTGTFMRGLIHIGTEITEGGRIDEPAANKISESLEAHGIKLDRLKTGTPARLAADSIDFSKVQEQPGDDVPLPFSYMNDTVQQEQVNCWITWTNETTHKIIRDNLHQAPLYTGQIKSTGPRYCPSIETKIIRFADKDRHQVFLEPEGLNTDWIYCNGISNALPKDVQDELLASIPGLENCKIHRYAYAIDYDYIPPTQMQATLESKHIKGLYFAGQINGTSGYEEAAGQGLMAGVNAARKIRGLEPVILRRDQAYIGVLIDDLITKGVDEPYRMFTSRAEYRLLLRYDNADTRLTPLGREWGIVTDSRWERFQQKQEQIAELKNFLTTTNYEGKKLDRQLCQLGRDESWLFEVRPDVLERNYIHEVIHTTVNDIRYAGYIEKQLKLVEKTAKIDKIKIPDDMDYEAISSIRNEARQRLSEIRPLTLGQAARITGITPADITVLMVQLTKRTRPCLD